MSGDNKNITVNLFRSDGKYNNLFMIMISKIGLIYLTDEIKWTSCASFLMGRI